MGFYEICFSPTGGTKRCADILARALAGQGSFVDLTAGTQAFDSIRLTPEDLAVLAVPSYAGRVPAPAVQRLARIRGNGARAVLLCVYGNRAFEDTLAELRDTAVQAGFQVAAAVAAIAEHSIVRIYAAGRPDGQDAAQLEHFAARIRARLEQGNCPEPAIPGNRPYKERKAIATIPRATTACVSCGLCAGQCPVQAIPPGDPRQVDTGRCIACMRCVAVCPHQARQVDEARLAALQQALEPVCSVRKEGELFL